MASLSRSKRRYLLQYSVLPSTQQRYNKAVDDFLTWVDGQGGDATTIDELDDLLLDYIHELYEDGRGKTVASTTIYGILLRMPQLKYQLHSSHQAIRAWNRLTPDKSYPPLTWELAVVIAVQMARAGYHMYGIGLLIAFDGLLRVSELCNLMVTDIADDGDTRIGVEHKGTLLRLRSTKTGKNQWVTLRDPSVIKLIRWLVNSSEQYRSLQFSGGHKCSQQFITKRQQTVKNIAVQPGTRRSGRNRIMSAVGAEAVSNNITYHEWNATHESKHQLTLSNSRSHIKRYVPAAVDSVRLFPFTTYQFRHVFKATCANLGLSDRYVPHSLRHGGATRYHHVLGWSIEDVLARGRWQSVKSARRYIQSGVAMLMSMHAPDNINDIAVMMARDPYHHIIISLSQEH